MFPLVMFLSSLSDILLHDLRLQYSHRNYLLSILPINSSYPSEAAGPVLNLMSKTILIVDDSLYMRTLIKDAVQEAGYQVVGEAANGESAIDQAMELNPDLITLDNILPDMIGTDILRVIKGEESLQSKVIMISAVGQESVIQEGMSIGAEDYFKLICERKPCSAISSLTEMPDLPAFNADSTSAALLPIEDTIPSPVITTRRM